MTEWTDHVKKVAAEKGISYKEAMLVAKESYKKSNPVKSEPVKSEPVKSEPVKSETVELIPHTIVKVDMPHTEKKKRIRGKGVKTKILAEDLGGMQHIYPLTHDKVVSMA
jgi:hypothetical protein